MVVRWPRGHRLAEFGFKLGVLSCPGDSNRAEKAEAPFHLDADNTGIDPFFGLW